MTEKKQELVTKDAPVVRQENTPMAMLAAAVAKGVDAEQLKTLMRLQERWEKNEAVKAFNAAFTAFKADAVDIIKTSLVKDGPLKGKKHADLFDVVSVTVPALAKHGLTTSWKLTKDEKDWMEVTCTLRHVQGHSESVSMAGAPDTGPGRNAIQARASTKTYLERYTLTAILGMAPRDADDDGAGGRSGMEAGQVADFDAAIEALADKEGAAKLWKSIAAVCKETKDRTAYDDLKAKITAKGKTFKVAA